MILCYENEKKMTEYIWIEFVDDDICIEKKRKISSRIKEADRTVVSLFSFSRSSAYASADQNNTMQPVDDIYVSNRVQEIN